WEVVATTPRHDDGVKAMASMTFTAEPTLEGHRFSFIDIRLDREDCLVVHHGLDITAFRGDGAVGETVSVMWPDSRYGWRFATAWLHPGDMWIQDCDNMVREDTP
ncbi:MAG: hypothetical protein ACRDVM_00395, partial [Acidimicrobiia bacterium]